MEWPFACFSSMDTVEAFRGAKGGHTSHVNTFFIMPGSQGPEIWDFKVCLIIIVGSFPGNLSRKKFSVTHTRPGRPVWVTLDFFWERKCLLCPGLGRIGGKARSNQPNQQILDLYLVQRIILKGSAVSLCKRYLY